MFEAFWGHIVVDDTGTVPDPHHPGRRSSEHRTIAMALNNMAKLVFFKTLDHLTWRNPPLLPELDPREVKSLKDQPGKNLIVYGRGSVVSQLTQHGLIDEYQFFVSPILLGSSRKLLSALSKQLKLNLLEARAFRSGDVMLRYDYLNQA
jgi:dihydrofolate reductase